MSSDLLRISTEQVASLVAQFDSCNSEMTNALDSVQNNINNFGWAWRGPAANNAINAFGTIRGDINTSRFNVMSSFSNYLKQTVVPGYEYTESVNTTLGDSYMGL